MDEAACLIPKYADIQGLGYDLIEFEQSFYYDKFANKALSPGADLDVYRLRLCAFVDLRDKDRQWIPFS